MSSVSYHYKLWAECQRNQSKLRVNKTLSTVKDSETYLSIINRYFIADVINLGVLSFFTS